MQYLIEHSSPQEKAFLISQMRGHLLQLARHKYASNVCEKALVHADSATRHSLIEFLIKSKENGASTIALMMKDQYGSACKSMLVTR